MRAPFGRRLLTVTANEQLGSYRLLRVADPGGPPPRAGQFAMLAGAERWSGGERGRPYLARAFSVARFQDGEAHFLLEDVGPGTSRLCDLAAGEQLWLVGPLGRGFSAPPPGQRAILVGGGVGIAPLAIWQDQLQRSEQNGPTVLLGFRDRDHAAGATLLGADHVATDDGSAGHHGPVTDLLAAELERDPLATIYACGPPAMLEAVRVLCDLRGLAVQLALEAGMACGFGSCYGCVVQARDGSYLRVCVDGPVIDGRLLEHVSTAGDGAPSHPGPLPHDQAEAGSAAGGRP